MLVAALLSDLNSLSVCPHDAAIALVSVHKSLPSSTHPPPLSNAANTVDTSNTATAAAAAADNNYNSILNNTKPDLQPSSSSSSAQVQVDTNTDLQRANEIISLHYDVKVKHIESGLDADLLQARDEVNSVVQALSRG